MEINLNDSTNFVCHNKFAPVEIPVCAFTKKKKGFVLVTGVLAIIAEGVGIVLIGFGIGNIVGLLAGLFVFLALKSFPSPASAAAA